MLYAILLVWNKKLKFCFINRKTTKESLPSTSTYKSFFLPEGTTILRSPYTTNDALKAEIRLDMKCLTSHYSQRSMGILPVLLAIRFLDERIITLLHLSCYFLAAVLFMCFKVPTTLNQNVLTWS